MAFGKSHLGEFVGLRFDKIGILVEIDPDDLVPRRCSGDELPRLLGLGA